MPYDSLSMCFSGSLGTSMFDQDVYLVGASGGVYALLSAHLANVLLVCRCVLFLSGNELDTHVHRPLAFSFPSAEHLKFILLTNGYCSNAVPSSLYP